MAKHYTNLMSSQLARKTPGTPRKPYRLNPPNTMMFPRELRDAIPDLPTYVGRALEIDSITGRMSNTRLFGRRVHLKLVVKETGKLKGQFTVRIDLKVEAARAMAATLAQLADQTEKQSES